jgi:hypothetical protein
MSRSATPQAKTAIADDFWTNPQIVTVAVFLLGGATAAIDIEDVAMKANALAPGRFAWRKYPEQIDIKKISSALFKAHRAKSGVLISGSDSSGWQLTTAGLEYSRACAAQMQDSDLSRAPMNARERQWHNAERVRLMGEVAFQKFSDGEENKITQREAELFFRLDDYVAGSAREKKIARLLEAFDSDAQLGQAVKYLSQKVRAATQKTAKGNSA